MSPRWLDNALLGWGISNLNKGGDHDHDLPWCKLLWTVRAYQIEIVGRRIASSQFCNRRWLDVSGLEGSAIGHHVGIVPIPDAMRVWDGMAIMTL